MQPMRIALLTPLYENTASSKGGIAKHYRYLADALVRQGQEVTVVFVPEFYFSHPPPTGLINQDGVRLHCHRIQFSRPLSHALARRTYVRRLCHTLFSIAAARRELAQLDPPPDVIEATSFGSLGLGSNFHRLHRRVITRVSTTAEQLSASFQTFQSRAQSAINWLERRAILSSAALVTHTRQHAHNIETDLRLPAGSFAIVPHGVPDVPPVYPPRPKWPGPTVLFAGQFTERKGIDVVLAAVPRLLQARPTCRFVVAGGSAKSELVAPQLRALSAEFGPRFQLVPDPDDATLQSWIETCDVFTAPSRYESFGLIYLEAMRAGRAIVATRAGGIPEVVSDETNGLLVPPGEIAALADAWLRCVDNPPLCRRLGKAGRQRFLAEFSVDMMARRSIALYEKVVGSHR